MKKNYHDFHKTLNSITDFNIDNNVFRAPNHNVRMISEGSSDTEDWSNDSFTSQEWITF